MNRQDIEEIFKLNNNSFLKKSIAFYHHQKKYNPIFNQFLSAFQQHQNEIAAITDFRFLPISLFKSHRIETAEVPTMTDIAKTARFESSGTTQQQKSVHLIQDVHLYEKSFVSSFNLFYKNIEDYCLLALLPSYLEQKNSSLVLMVDHLIKKTNHPLSSFYLYNHEELFSVLKQLDNAKQKTILIGVTYALLDFSEKYTADFKQIIFMETGGMKGRREEMTREEVHHLLKKRFGVMAIHSEYGMTELMSQAYSSGDGIFRCPPWMKVLVRDINDPLSMSEKGKGAINIIDLANIHSCCFIATDDMGEVFEDGSFKINGRIDYSDLRGCSLMYV